MKLGLHPRAYAFLGWLVRGLWLVVMPALLAGLSFRYLIPSSKSAGGGLLTELAQLAARSPGPVVAALFVYFAVIFRYWAARLPAADLWLSERVNGPFGLKSWLLWGASLALAVGGAVVLHARFYQPYRVLSASMLPGLEPSALILAKPSAYRSGGVVQQPRRADVVVFQTPQAGIAAPLVKRVIGLPGDTLATHIGHPVINGWVVPSCNAGNFAYVSDQGVLDGMLEVEFLGDASYLTVYSTSLRKDLAAYEVPAGEVFLMGDNRNNSSDSRAWNDGKGGSLPLAQLIGRVDRLLIGTKRNGDFDPSTLFRPLTAPLAIDGLDVTSLRAGIDRCRSQRPRQTEPPRAAP